MKKLLSLFLTAALCLSLSVSAFAAETSPQVFQDISYSRENWCYTAVMKAYNSGLMNGYGNGCFGRDDILTRAQLVQILYNRYGTDMGANSGFSDVSPDKWYAKAVTWAVKSGFVSGYSADRFGPEDKLTRAQALTILYNFAGKPAVDSRVRQALENTWLQYPIPEYALDACTWAYYDTSIVPKSSSNIITNSTNNLSRAQAASLLVNYVEWTEGPLPEPAPGPVPEKLSSVPVDSRNADGTTSADYVNSVSSVGKDAAYPTRGASAVPNANGYFTDANVDIEGSRLLYEALPYLNEFLAQNGGGTAKWTQNDEIEEYTLMRAKEGFVNFAHERPNASSCLLTENLYKGSGNARSIINAWDKSPGHHGTLLCAGQENAEICIAIYRRCCVFTVVPTDGDRISEVIDLSSNNYFHPDRYR